MTGVAVVSMVVLLQLMAEIVSGHERVRVMWRLGSWIVEVVLLMTLLNTHYAWATRRRLSSPRRLLLSSAAISGAVGVAVALVTFLAAQRFPELRTRVDRAPYLLRTLTFGFVFAQLYGGLWALAFVFPYAAEDARVRALDAERMRTALEIGRLRAHLEPHFLFNTLNTIAGLIVEEPRQARRLIVCLADLLRDASRCNELQSVEEEIAWLHRYADILVSRHPDLLRFRWEIADEARGALVPRLLLQPLVENAVKHGTLRRRGGGEVLVKIEVEPIRDRLVCTVEDEGPGLDGSPLGAEPTGTGLGLQAVRRRLELEYGHADLRLESTARGARTVVQLPRVLSPVADGIASTRANVEEPRNVSAG